MNGRLYDPKLHRFLQPDNFVQDPYNTQSFNRYGYCWNNPLKYTDKNGEELVSAILIGAGIALASYLTMNLVNGTPITLKGALMATFVGAISGAVTFGIGEALNGVTTFALKATYSALAHGTFQGLVSGIQGGGFWAGAASGALSSMASSLFQGVGQDNGGWHGLGGCGATTDTGMIIFGTVMGGAGAALTGGNFWRGAVTGLVVSGLNNFSNSIIREAHASAEPTNVKTSNSNDVKIGDVLNLHTDDYYGALSKWAKQSKPGVGEVEIHGHGNRTEIGGMKSVQQINDLLYTKSPTWRKMIDGGMKTNIKLKLFSCSTGSGEGSIAWQIKKAFPNVTVVAPTAYWKVNYYNAIFSGKVKVTSGFVENPGIWRKF